jgi:Tfp pilus assembly protein PilF
MRRSEALLKKDDKLGALRDADQAVSIDGDDAGNYIARAAVMRALDRKEDAVSDLRKALSLNPSATRKRIIEDTLRELGETP